MINLNVLIGKTHELFQFTTVKLFLKKTAWFVRKYILRQKKERSEEIRSISVMVDKYLRGKLV